MPAPLLSSMAKSHSSRASKHTVLTPLIRLGQNNVFVPLLRDEFKLAPFEIKSWPHLVGRPVDEAIREIEKEHPGKMIVSCDNQIYFSQQRNEVWIDMHCYYPFSLTINFVLFFQSSRWRNWFFMRPWNWTRNRIVYVCFSTRIITSRVFRRMDSFACLTNKIHSWTFSSTR